MSESSRRGGGDAVARADRLERLEICKGTLINESTVQSTDSRQLAHSIVVHMVLLHVTFAAMQKKEIICHLNCNS